MSNSWLNAMWDVSLPCTRKFVLVALADYANDAGECFPSVPMVASRCGLTERAVRSAIRDLEAIGAVLTKRRAGRSAVYVLADPGTWFRPTPERDSGVTPEGDSGPTPERGSPHPGMTFPPEGDSARNDVPPTPEPHSPPPRNDVPPTPERGSPRTIKEPSVEPPRNHQEEREPALVIPEWLPKSAWRDWCQYRRTGKERWTRKAQELSLRTLAKLRDEGHDPQTVIELSIERGWRGLFAPRDAAAKKPAASDNFRGKSYVGTAPEDLPPELRDAARDAYG